MILTSYFEDRRRIGGCSFSCVLLGLCRGVAVEDRAVEEWISQEPSDEESRAVICLLVHCTSTSLGCKGRS